MLLLNRPPVDKALPRIQQPKSACATEGMAMCNRTEQNRTEQNVPHSQGDKKTLVLLPRFGLNPVLSPGELIAAMPNGGTKSYSTNL